MLKNCGSFQETTDSEQLFPLLALISSSVKPKVKQEASQGTTNSGFLKISLIVRLGLILLTFKKLPDCFTLVPWERTNQHIGDLGEVLMVLV